MRLFWAPLAAVAGVLYLVMLSPGAAVGAGACGLALHQLAGCVEGWAQKRRTRARLTP